MRAALLTFIDGGKVTSVAQDRPIRGEREHYKHGTLQL
jgi:hypothetical protein